MDQSLSQNQEIIRWWLDCPRIRLTLQRSHAQRAGLRVSSTSKRNFSVLQRPLTNLSNVKSDLRPESSFWRDLLLEESRLRVLECNFPSVFPLKRQLRSVKAALEATISIDIEAFESDSVWDGLKGYVTNSALSDKEVIANYHNLWFIERAFRMNKTDLRIRPMYHRLRNRIEGHICICFCAYVLQLEIERLLKDAKSDITIDRARELVKTMYALTYTKPGHVKPTRVMLRMDQE